MIRRDVLVRSMVRKLATAVMAGGLLMSTSTTAFADSWAPIVVKDPDTLVWKAYESYIDSDNLVRNCQDLWIGVLRDLLISCLVVGSFDEFALLEPGSCSDQGDQVWRVDRPPAGLG